MLTLLILVYVIKISKIKTAFKKLSEYIYFIGVSIDGLHTIWVGTEINANFTSVCPLTGLYTNYNYVRSHQKRTKIDFNSSSLRLNQRFEKLMFTVNDKAHHIITRSESLLLNHRNLPMWAFFDHFPLATASGSSVKPLSNTHVPNLAFVLRSSGCYLLFLSEFIKLYLRWLNRIFQDDTLLTLNG